MVSSSGETATVPSAIDGSSGSGCSIPARCAAAATSPRPTASARRTVGDVLRAHQSVAQRDLPVVAVPEKFFGCQTWPLVIRTVSGVSTSGWLSTQPSRSAAA